MQKEKTADSTSLVSKDVRIEGEIEGPENLHVEGYIRGTIALSGDIFVGNTGIVEADVEAKNIVIQGKVNGNITALKQLEIHPSGRLIGDCMATSIDIKEGAVFEGRSMMMKSSGKSSAANSPSGITTAPKSKQPQT